MQTGLMVKSNLKEMQIQLLGRMEILLATSGDFNWPDNAVTEPS